MTVSIGWIGSSRWRAGPRIGWQAAKGLEPLVARRTGGDACARLLARTAPRTRRGSAGGGLLAMAALVSEEGLFQLRLGARLPEPDLDKARFDLNLVAIADDWM